MRTVCVILLVVAATTVYATPVDPPPLDKEYYDVNDAPNLFEKFIKDYNKQYTDDADRQVHYEAFVNNLKNINKWNAEQPLTAYGINQFSDFTDEQRKRLG
ncbi:uncharacterized protein LOC142974959 [Anticarsia gemmatalis]|uniref:uncharacterized protein LOC142974959 n=1 Tax=Anticarsia gemmatalis TaxID=129554 RepID=UPI003F75B8B2